MFWISNRCALSRSLRTHSRTVSTLRNGGNTPKDLQTSEVVVIWDMTKHGDGVTWDESYGREGAALGETLGVHGQCPGADPQGPLSIFAFQWGVTAGERRVAPEIVLFIWAAAAFMAPIEIMLGKSLECSVWYDNGVDGHWRWNFNYLSNGALTNSLPIRRSGWPNGFSIRVSMWTNWCFVMILRGAPLYVHLDHHNLFVWTTL